MECERVAELLPWLASGTLEAGERDEVRAHLASCSTCRRDLAETRFALAVHAEHLPAKTIVDYAFDRLGPDRALADRHLVACPECAEMLELARESRRLESSDPDVVVPLPNRGFRWYDVALAASLAVSLGLGAWLYAQWQEDRALVASAGAREQALGEQLARLERERAEAEVARSRVRELEAENERLRQSDTRPEPPTSPRAAAPAAPELNVPTYDLSPAGHVERGEAATNEIDLPAEARSATFILGSQATSVDGPLSLQVADERGRVVWRGRGLVRHATGDYTVSIPTSLLPPGRYTLTVFAGRDAVERYSLRISRGTRRG